MPREPQTGYIPAMGESMFASLRARWKESKRDPNWHRNAVGGLWDEVGRLQFDFLVGRGLKPEHFLLDVGCGSLRGGVHFINYLDVGHYVGIESEPGLLRAGRRVELPSYGLESKEPTLLLTSTFDLSPVDVEFDYALAQSVFTHLEPEMIRLCLRRIRDKLKPNGVFYATYFEGKDIELGTEHRWIRNYREGVFYPFSLFRELADSEGLVAERVGEWDHPRGQLMMTFRE